MIRRLLQSLRRRDYTLEDQMKAVRAVIASEPKTRLRVRPDWKKPDPKVFGRTA